MAPEKSVLVCLGDNRRIVKCSSAEEGLPIVKVIKKDVLGGEVEHILIQIEELWGVRKVFVDFQDRDIPNRSILQVIPLRKVSNLKNK